MVSAAELVIDVLVNTQGASNSIDGLADRFDGIGGRLTKALGGVAIGAAVAGFGQAAVSAASDLEQAVGGVDAVFKQNAASVHAWAADTSDAIRIPQTEFENYAVILGSLLKNAGTPIDQLGVKTKALIQLGADLAARYGTSTGKAVETLTSALKGNFEMLDEYGINVTAASVKTEALKIAQGDTAKAMEDGTKQAAILNLVLRQSADAQGAAASESGTFAAAQERLNEKWTNFLAAVGGPAIGAFGGLLNIITSLLGVLQPLAVGIASAVQWITQLPGPMLAAGAAFLAFVALRGPLVALFSGIGTAITSFYVKAKILQATAVSTGQSMTTMGALARTAGTGVRALGASMLAAFGGPIGLAVAAVVTALTFGLSAISSANERVKQMAEEAASAVDSVAEKIKGLDPSKISQVGREAALAELKTRSWGRESKDLSDFNDRLGVSLSDVLDGMTGVPGVADKITRAYDAQRAKLQDIIQANQTWTDSGPVNNSTAEKAQEDLTILTEMFDAYGPLIDITGKAAAQNKEEADALNVLGTAAENSTAAVLDAKDAQDALKKAVESAKEAAQATGGQWLIDTIADQMNRASRSAQIFNASMDISLNRNRSYQSTTLDWASGIRGLGDAFKEAADKGELNITALKEWDIGALAATKNGSALAGSLLDQSESFGKFVTQAFEASGGADNLNVALGAAHTAADQAYKDFISMATAAGLSGSEAEALAQKLGIVNAQNIDDKIFQIIANDQEAAMKAKLWETVTFDDKTLKFVTKVPAAQELADQMNAKYANVPANPVQVGTEIQPPANQPPGAFGQVIMGEQQRVNGGTVVVGTEVQPPNWGASVGGALGGILSTLTGGGSATVAPIQVPTTIQPPTNVPAGAVGQAIQGQAPTTPPVQVTIQADTGPAQMAITALVTQSRILKIIVDANLSIAQGVVAAFVGARYALTVAFLADPSVAISVVNAFTRARYETTVKILGDNSDAIRAVRAVTTGIYSVSVRIYGDNLDAISSIRAITTGYYTATVHVNADTTAFWAAFNALPSSRQVTVNQVQGTTVPAPTPAPSGFLAPTLFGARGLAPMTLAGSGGPVSYGGGGDGSGNVYITVEGAIDPDRTARQIESLLKGRTRRTGSVVLGG